MSTLSVSLTHFSYLFTCCCVKETAIVSLKLINQMSSVDIYTSKGPIYARDIGLYNLGV